jgi:hypothetical protein
MTLWLVESDGLALSARVLIRCFDATAMPIAMALVAAVSWGLGALLLISFPILKNDGSIAGALTLAIACRQIDLTAAGAD